MARNYSPINWRYKNVPQSTLIEPIIQTGIYRQEVADQVREQQDLLGYNLDKLQYLSNIEGDKNYYEGIKQEIRSSLDSLSSDGSYFNDKYATKNLGRDFLNKVNPLQQRQALVQSVSAKMDEDGYDAYNKSLVLNGLIKDLENKPILKNGQLSGDYIVNLTPAKYVNVSDKLNSWVKDFEPYTLSIGSMIQYYNKPEELKAYLDKTFELKPINTDNPELNAKNAAENSTMQEIRRAVETLTDQSGGYRDITGTLKSIPAKALELYLSNRSQTDGEVRSFLLQQAKGLSKINNKDENELFQNIINDSVKPIVYAKARTTIDDIETDTNLIVQEKLKTENQIAIDNNKATHDLVQLREKTQLEHDSKMRELQFGADLDVAKALAIHEGKGENSSSSGGGTNTASIYNMGSELLNKKYAEYDYSPEKYLNALRQQLNSDPNNVNLKTELATTLELFNNKNVYKKGTQESNDILAHFNKAGGLNHSWNTWIVNTNRNGGKVYNELKAANPSLDQATLIDISKKLGSKELNFPSSFVSRDGRIVSQTLQYGGKTINLPVGVKEALNNHHYNYTTMNNLVGKYLKAGGNNLATTNNGILPHDSKDKSILLNYVKTRNVDEILDKDGNVFTGTIKNVIGVSEKPFNSKNGYAFDIEDDSGKKHSIIVPTDSQFNLILAQITKGDSTKFNHIEQLRSNLTTPLQGLDNVPTSNKGIQYVADDGTQFDVFKKDGQWSIYDKVSNITVPNLDKKLLVAYLDILAKQRPNLRLKN